MSLADRVSSELRGDVELLSLLDERLSQKQELEALRITGVLSRNDKAIVFFGTFRDDPVALKICTADGEWRSYFANELEIYKAFLQSPPSFIVPKALYIDADAGLILLERLPGEPLNSQRFPREPLSSESVAKMLIAIQSVREFQGPGRADQIAEHYHVRFDRYVAAKLLEPGDKRFVNAAFQSSRIESSFSHGDPNPTNFLVAGDRVALIDWEMSGHYLPHYDEASIWTFLVNDPSGQRLIEERIKQSVQSKLFWLNALMITARSLRTHRETREGNVLRENIPGLEKSIKRLRMILKNDRCNSLVRTS